MERDLDSSIGGTRFARERWSRWSRRGGLALVALLLVSVPLAVHADPCGFPPNELPPGSYIASCDNCTVQGPLLTCDCLRIDQTLSRTTLDITNCRSDPANTNGVLVCDPCSTTGACCLDGGGCSRLSSVECADVGEYQGDDSTCELAGCPGCASETVTWVGGRAGAFDDPANWDAARVPLSDTDAGRCDGVTIRGVNGLVLDLDAGAPALGAAAAPVPVKRVEHFHVDASRTLRPIDGTIEGIALSPVAGERSVEVLNGASLLLDGGGVFARHLGVGSRGEGSIEVATTGGYLETTGRLGLGIEGSGNLLVRDGGTVIAAETVLGEGNDQGSVTVRGTASTLETGSLAVGLEDDGALVIESGAKVTSDTSVIDFNLSGDSRGRATVRGKDAVGTNSTWIADSLDVGARGMLVVEDSGFVSVLGPLEIGSEGAPGDCLTGRACVTVSELGVLFVDALAVGNEGGAELRVVPGEAGGIGVDGVTAIGLTPQAATFVLQGTGLLHSLVIAPNERSVGWLDLLSGAELIVLGPLRVGEGLYSMGEIVLSRDDASADVPVLTVQGGTSFFGFPEPPNGERPRSALLVLAPGKFSSDHDLVIEATGQLESSGGRVELEAPARLVNRGRILGDLFLQGTYAQEAGGIKEGRFLQPPAASPTQQLRATSPLLLSPLAAAPPPPPVAPMVVTGDAALAGKALLQFGNGVAPKQGDAFELLRVEGEVTGAFDEIVVQGLAPGSDFASEVVNGRLVLTSLTDAEPLPFVNLAGKPVLLEKKKAAKLKLTRSGDKTAPLTVAYTVSGTAESGVDYVALPGTIQFPARKKSVTLLVQPIADALEEGVETIEITLAPDASFAPGLAAALTLELRDGKTK